MYKGILLGRKGDKLLISLLALIFICANYAFCAELKSEEQLLEETRASIEKYLNEGKEAKDSQPAKENEKPAAESTIVEEKPEIKEESPAETEEIPAEIEKSSFVPGTSIATATNVPGTNNETNNEKTPPEIEESSFVPGTSIATATNVPGTNSEKTSPLPIKKEEVAPAAKAPMLYLPAPVKKEENLVPVPAATEKNELPSDVTSVITPEIKTDDKANQPTAEEVNLLSSVNQPVVEKAMEEPVLKKMDVDRIGASPYYETYEGLRLLKYFTVAQRVEIYQEPRPIDAYILDAFAMRIIYPHTPWNIQSDYRTQITPIFTRAYGTEITMSDPKNKEGQIRYTHDYREIYRNYYPKYPNIKREIWDQNDILFMHAKQIEPLGWLYTSNLGYRYSTLSAKDSDPLQGYYEIRHTYYGSLSIAPTDKTEYFFQGEYYKSMHVKCSYDYRPDHFLGRTEIRIKSNDYKTSFVPQFSFSKDYYYPFLNTFEKYEIAFRVGRDWTKRFSTTNTLQYVYSFRDEPDNQGPDLYGTSFTNPHEDKGEYVSMENRFSYNVYDRLYLQSGLDIANGINWSIFDNVGLLGGIEYFAPGIIRIDVGYRGNYYYNLSDWLNSVYFKFYLFM